ncbi:MAG TPA: vitamin B12-dependent ribonucleotide reductase [Acidobacteriaceae bacterium]|nr:vitamin B12-dependent ribonucleotide reductase [Acidobacteriaceae bacterium]
MAEATGKTIATASTSDATPAASGALHFDRFFSKPDASPYDEVQWERRTALITDASGKAIFEQKDVEVPVDWSMTATNIVASKYLHGQLDTPARETGVRQLISRVAETVRDWGLAGEYFSTPEDAAVFHDELVHLLVTQKAAFNSPVWFNVGCDRLEPNSDARNWHWNPHTCAIEFSVTGYRNPQCSACFINAVDDSLDSILTLAKTEGMLFKWGSGTGTNLSSLRGSMEQLSGGGTASGPLSFMRGFDAFAGVIKSGGKTRRAAKMVILNVDHPDIIDFVECKMKEEAKAWALMREGYDGSSGPDSEAYSSIFFQNANNSVRVGDTFMHAVERDAEFTTYTVKDHKPVKTYRARDLMHKIAEATWQCGDPGMQYDSIINRWHTSKNTGRINASNPCSEYMFLDNSACNLASFNLLKFLTPAGTFDIKAYRKAIDVLITAMDILVDNSGYPTEAIARNSHDYRPLGLGYANLGALLMAFGLPYDSDAGRDFAATLTAIMCGEAYLQSSRIAEKCPALASATPLTATSEVKKEGGACPGYYVNREPFLDVIRMHRAEVNNIGKSVTSGDKTFAVPQFDELLSASRECWDQALAHGEKHGYRNSQVTVLAPTGTIGFMMDCDTTGIEPDLALVKYKKLVGGGMIKIVNNTVPTALFKFGYNNAQVDSIVSYIDSTGTIEGAPGIKPEHLAVFDCSFKPSKGTRSIHYMGHIKMMAAAQPFISGAISKTVNLPHDCSIDDIAEAYLESWRKGLKAVAIYRDGSKGAQPLNVSDGNKAKAIKMSTLDDALSTAADRILSALSIGITPSESDLKCLEGRPAEKVLVTSMAVTGAAVALATASAEGASRAPMAPAAPEAPVSSAPLNQHADAPPRAVRHRLPEERPSLTHKFSIAGHEGYITVGLYPNGQPGEIFIRMAKEGSTVAGLMDSFATAISLALQHGVPLRVLCDKFAHSRFEPSGWTGNEHIGYAKSIMDYIFRWLQLRFLSGQQLSLFAGFAGTGVAAATAPPPSALLSSTAPHPAASSTTSVAATQAPEPLVESTLESEPSFDIEASATEAAPSSAPATYPTEAEPSPTSEPQAAAMAPTRSSRLLDALRGMGSTRAPQGGIVPEVKANAQLHPPVPEEPANLNLPDRGLIGGPGDARGSGEVFHAADAMKEMYDMGDAPSCPTCGAIMVRNGSCYRCMSCGSTSGCS